MVIMVIMVIMDIMVYYLFSHGAQGKMDKVFCRFIGFRFSVYHFHIHSELIYIYIHIFPAIRTNTSTILSLCMDHLHIANIFRFQLRHHTSLFKLTLLQLHHCKSLTIIMLITHDPLTLITRALLTSTTRAHYIHETFSKLPLFHANIPFHSSVFVHLQIQPVSQLPSLSLTFPSPTHKSDSSPISKYMWNTSTLLLLSNDVEINPGPRPINQNPVFCCICSNKINREIQQDTAPTCSVENCNARCHQACNGLSIHQTRHAKDSGRSITWTCPDHGIGIAEIITPPLPVYEIPSRPTAVGKSCSVCKNPIRAHYADLAYHCANPSCGNVCHLAATCSGFVNPRVPARTRALSTRVWHCHLHSSLSTSSHSATQPDTSPPRPTPTSLKSLLDQGLSLADGKLSKEKCAKCSAALCSNTVPVRCSLCSKGFHQKCSI